MTVPASTEQPLTEQPLTEDTIIPPASPFPVLVSDVDLAFCDREPIHLLGGIQSIGCLFVASADWRLLRVSANAGAHLGLPPAELLGQSLHGLLSKQALHDLAGRLHLLRGPSGVERVFGVPLREGSALYDFAIHMSGPSIVIEAELSDTEDGLETGTTVRGMIGRLQQSEDRAALCRDAVRQIRALTGFHRVMLYRFDHDGNGEVVAEAASGFLQPFLGLRYPASDIPVQARRLYERNWLRLIADVEAPPVPLVPVLDAHGQTLDLSLSVLRSVSPVHLEYLRNMGVRASMSISVLRKGRLWGLIACHHSEPIRISFERRTAAELFGQMFSLMLESREREEELAHEAVANAVHNRLMAALGALRPGGRNLGEMLDTMAEMLPCDGIGLWSADGTALHGHTPGTENFAGIVRFLIHNAPGGLYATDRLGDVYPPARAFIQRTAGLLAVPLSRSPRDYLVFFRREVPRTVVWAGDPSKSAEPALELVPGAVAQNGLAREAPRLSPRKSFAAWRQQVAGQSLPWTESDLQMAERLRVTLLEMVLQLADVAEQARRVGQQKQEILIAELNHRVRNILALIRGLVRQSRGSAVSVEEFAELIGGRIQALARAHDQITADNWQAAPLVELVQAEAAAYLEEKASRVVLDGPPVLLEPQAHTTMALVLHEMMTNAAKYGALSSSHGQVRLTWRMLDGGALELCWSEEGGPPVRPPSRQGFGTTIIERAVPHDLKGEAELHYRLTGLTARFVLPPPHAQLAPDRPPVEASPQPAAVPDAPAPVAMPARVLLVEDNLLIAMDTEDQLRSLGAADVDIAASVQAALQSISRQAPNWALLDMNLGRENSFPIADALAERGIPFVFATGYGETSAFPDRFRKVPVIAKPYTQADIRGALMVERAAR